MTSAVDGIHKIRAFVELANLTNSKKYGESETDKQCKTGANSPTSSISPLVSTGIAAMMVACVLIAGLSNSTAGSLHQGE